MVGDNYLGDENFTRMLEKESLERNEIDEGKLDRKTTTAAHKATGSCRKLSSQGNRAATECKIDGEEKTPVIDLKEYGELREPLLEQIRKPLQYSIPDTHVELSDADEVVLVGGATRLPVIRKFIVKLFHKFLNISVHLDEAVTLEATAWDAIKARDKEVKEIILMDVCAFALRTEVSVERQEGVYESGHFCPIMEKDTVISISRTERFYTARDKQEKIRISVYRGESRLTVNNLLLGSLEIPVSKNRAGGEVVDVAYTYDINSILGTGVKVISAGEAKKQIIRRKYNTMTGEEIQVRMEELSYLKIAPRNQEENRLLLSRGEQCYEESTGDRGLVIEDCMREFGLILDSRDRKRIMDAERKLREEINREEEQEGKTQKTRQEAARMLSGCG